MRVFVGDYRSGKTDWLIKEAARTDGYIACHSSREVQRVADRALVLGADIMYPVTYSELMGGGLHGRHKPVLIDNALMFIQYVVSHDIHALTISAEALS